MQWQPPDPVPLPSIAIVGCGQMGSALAHLFAANGYPLRLTSRRRISALTVARHLPAAFVGSLEETIAAADVVILATPFQVTCAEVAPRLRGLVAGKPIVDVSNPTMRCARPPAESAAEQIAAALPTGHVVKALNCVAARWLAGLGGLGGEAKLTVPIAGDSATARHLVRALLEHLGFDVADAGPLRNSRLIEGLTPLLRCLEAEKDAGDAVGFQVVRRTRQLRPMIG